MDDDFPHFDRGEPVVVTAGTGALTTCVGTVVFDDRVRGVVSVLITGPSPITEGDRMTHVTDIHPTRLTRARDAMIAVHAALNAARPLLEDDLDCLLRAHCLHDAQQQPVRSTLGWEAVESVQQTEAAIQAIDEAQTLIGHHLASKT